MKQETLEYLKGKVISAIPKTTGEIITQSIITFENGIVVEGQSVRDINIYDKVEAENAAYEDAIKTLYPGVEFILTKSQLT